MPGQRANIHDGGILCRHAIETGIARIRLTPLTRPPGTLSPTGGEGVLRFMEGGTLDKFPRQHQPHRQVNFVPDDDSFLVRKLRHVSFVLARERL